MQCVWIALVLLVSVGLTQGLKCYTCLPTDTNCNDPFDKGQQGSLLGDCPAGSDYACVKAKVSASGAVGRLCGNEIACSLLGGNNACLEQSGEIACCCTGDGCNSATTQRIGYVALAAMLTFGKLVMALF